MKVESNQERRNTRRLHGQTRYNEAKNAEIADRKSM